MGRKGSSLAIDSAAIRSPNRGRLRGTVQVQVPVLESRGWRRSLSAFLKGQVWEVVTFPHGKGELFLKCIFRCLTGTNVGSLWKDMLYSTGTTPPGGKCGNQLRWFLKILSCLLALTVSCQFSPAFLRRWYGGNFYLPPPLC